MPECTKPELVRALSALSDPNRYRIVELLSTRETALSCRDIGEALGLSPSLLTHHLSVLESARLVERRKSGFLTLNRLRTEVLGRHVAALRALAGEPLGDGPLAEAPPLASP